MNNFSKIFFFFNDSATTGIYTLSLHDALPIWLRWVCSNNKASGAVLPFYSIYGNARLCHC